MDSSPKFYSMSWRVTADYENHVGENPLWHPDEEQLYWCSHRGGDGFLYRYDPVTDEHEQVLETGFIGGFTIQSDGSLLLFRDSGRVTRWDSTNEEMCLKCDLADEDDDVQFNDVIADPEGRVYCGAVYDDERTGGLYRIDLDGTDTKVVGDIAVTNGLGFSPDLQTLYYTDSNPKDRKILAFDYDRDTGALDNRRQFVEVPAGEGEGLPDGLTVDTDGHVLSARAFGGAVVRHAPDGSLESRFDLPVSFVTSVAFGGAGCDTLYVTTGGGDEKDEHGEHAGALFELETNLRGSEQYLSRI